MSDAVTNNFITFSVYRFPCYFLLLLSLICFIPPRFYEKPTLELPVFTNQKKSEENFHFYEMVITFFALSHFSLQNVS